MNVMYLIFLTRGVNISCPQLIYLIVAVVHKIAMKWGLLLPREPGEEANQTVVQYWTSTSQALVAVFMRSLFCMGAYQ